MSKSESVIEKERERERERQRERERLLSRMPAYATNMRLKFPILALILEIITIILFAMFVVYEDGKPAHHATLDNSTHEELLPMNLYPSKYAFNMGIV